MDNVEPDHMRLQMSKHEATSDRKRLIKTQESLTNNLRIP